jgi:hypothetical protein
VERAVDTGEDRGVLVGLLAALDSLGRGTRNTPNSPLLREMFGSAGVLTRSAGCSETRNDRVEGYHQLSQRSSTHALALSPFQEEGRGGGAGGAAVYAEQRLPARRGVLLRRRGCVPASWSRERRRAGAAGRVSIEEGSLKRIGFQEGLNKNRSLQRIRAGAAGRVSIEEGSLKRIGFQEGLNKKQVLTTHSSGCCR